MYSAIASLTDSQKDDLHHLYQQQWWSHQRQRPDIDKMLTHSDEIVAFCTETDQKLVAFSRILTNYVYRADIFDVIVASDHQGKGLGRQLIEGILHHH